MTADDPAITRMRARAQAAWDAAAQRQPWEDPARQEAIDARAESRREQDNYEYAELVMREEDARW